jgi:hypothetical protein
VVAARALYQPVKNARTGKLIFSRLELGSEMGWSTFGGQQPFVVATQMFQQMIFKNPAWDYKTLNYDADIAAVDAVEKGNINAMDPNLKPFLSRGGKLIQYHGWADQQIPSGTSPEYYKAVTDALGGADKVKDGYRLFMVPGMGHCGGGDGTASFDMLTALEQWVERAGAGPDSASRIVDGRADRTRPSALTRRWLPIRAQVIRRRLSFVCKGGFWLKLGSEDCGMRTLLVAITGSLLAHPSRRLERRRPSTRTSFLSSRRTARTVTGRARWRRCRSSPTSRPAPGRSASRRPRRRSRCRRGLPSRAFSTTPTRRRRC